MRGGPRRPWIVALAASTAAAVLAVLAWFAHGVLTDPVQWQDVGYHVHDDRSISITFDVTKAPTATVTCRVHALSKSFGEGGVADVRVGPSKGRTQRLTVSVPTSERAVTGVVDRCDRPA